MLVTFLQRIASIKDFLDMGSEFNLWQNDIDSFECSIHSDHNGANPSLVYHSYSPRDLRAPSTAVAACSHSMLLIREGQQPPLAHWTLFPGHANLRPVLMLVSQCIAACMFLCQHTVHAL